MKNDLASELAEVPLFGNILIIIIIAIGKHFNKWSYFSPNYLKKPKKFLTKVNFMHRYKVFAI